MPNTIKKSLILVFIIFVGSSVYPYRSWYQKAHVGGEARHRVVAFSIGNKGYVGGGHVNSGVLKTYADFWQYDPGSNTWTQIADFGGGKRFHSSAFTIENRGFVVAGEDHEDSYTNDLWEYIPEVNTWIRRADYPGEPRRGGVTFVLDGFGYYGTGQSRLGYLADFYKYDIESNTWSEVADFIGEPRNAAVSFASENRGYVGTGHVPGRALKDFYEYDASLDSWSRKADVSDTIRQDATSFFIDGKGYIGTGHDELGNDFKDIWEYDLSSDTWTEIEEFGGQKRRYAATFVIENNVYLTGGTDGTNFKDLWLYAPSVGLEKIQSAIDIHLFPNPSTDKIRININNRDYNMTDLKIQIYDIQGKNVFSSNFQNDELIIEQSTIGKGIFLVEIIENNKILRTEKIIFN